MAKDYKVWISRICARLIKMDRGSSSQCHWPLLHTCTCTRRRAHTHKYVYLSIMIPLWKVAFSLINVYKIKRKWKKSISIDPSQPYLPVGHHKLNSLASCYNRLKIKRANSPLYTGIIILSSRQEYCYTGILIDDIYIKKSYMHGMRGIISCNVYYQFENVI